MITGLWGNPNFDDNKQTRKRALMEIEDNFHEILLATYGTIKDTQIELKEDPFFAAMNVPDVPSGTEEPSPPKNDRGNVDIDQW